MKKTLMINLGGIVFHIDEDAYLQLNQYLENLKKHFGAREGAREILNDIESRMAEIFGERRTESKQVITIEEVNEAIAVMGRPAEIDQEEGAGPANGHTGNGKGPKRFFRDPDNRVIAGVCSGIATYFHLDPVWVRLFFVLFTLAFGSGVLVYLVLWVVIPEAQTTSDRLEMRGRKINIHNIEKSMRGEVSGIGDRIGTMAGESAQTIRRAGAGTAVVLRAIGRAVAEILTFAGKVLIVLTGIVLALFSVGMLIALLAYTLGWTAGFYVDNEFTLLSFPELAKLMVGCDMPVYYLQAVLLIVFGIPLFMLFYNGLRMVVRFERIRHLGFTMLNIWLVGLFFMTWSVLRVYNLYKHQEQKQIEIALENPKCDTLNVSLISDDPGMKHLRDEQFVLVGDIKTVVNGNQELLVVPKIRIEESEDSLFSITQVAIARGKSRTEAHQHLAGMRFQSATSGDSLRISPFARLVSEGCWRGQFVTLIIRVPRGKYVHLDKDVRDLRPYWYNLLNSSGETTYQMTENGIEVNEGTDFIRQKGDTTAIITTSK